MVHGLETMAKLNDEATASDSAAKPIEVVIVREGFGDEAFYADGILVDGGSPVDYDVVVGHVKGRLMRLTVATMYQDLIDLFPDWPKSYTDLVPFIEKSEGF
jgi:hypothetical protein